MYNIEFIYNDQKKSEAFYNVIKVCYSDVVVENDDILNHSFPTDCDIHVYTEEGNYHVSPNNLKYIEVYKD